MNYKYFFLILVFGLLVHTQLWASCNNQDNSENMCKGNGYCTYYPLGKDKSNCGGKWSVPKNWIAMNKDCLSNTKDQGTLSCASGKGIVTVVICGKSNCYKCECE